MLKEKIEKLLKKALKKAFQKEINLQINWCKDFSHGDFSSNIALILAKELKKNPLEIGKEIIKNFPTNNLLKKIESKNGFLNFFLQDREVFQEIFYFNPEQKIIAENFKNKKINIDFSHPNIAKPLHFGHFRSTIIGESLVRILRYCSAEVLADNYLGDWGTQFGKLVVAIRKWGDKEKIKTNPIQELVQLYQYFYQQAENNPGLEKEGAEEFRKMEKEKDPENLALWQWIVDVSLDELKTFYQKIDANFDCIRGESYWEKFITKTLDFMRKKKVLVSDQGAEVVFFEEETNLPPMLFVRSDGASFYQTRDIARILFYEKENFTDMIYVVGADQNLHFKQLAETSKMLGLKSKIKHVQFGLMRLKSGKMSTRKGTSIGIEEVLEKAEEYTEKILQKKRITSFSATEKKQLKKIISMGALKFNDLSQNRLKDIVFDWDKMLSFEGYSAPFLQYSYARGKSILRKSKINLKQNMFFETDSSWQKEEIELVKKILNFTEIVILSAEKLRPNILAEYLFSLAHYFNKFYARVKILSLPKKEKEMRLFLINKTCQVLKKGLYLLGIDAPDRM